MSTITDPLDFSIDTEDVSTKMPLLPKSEYLLSVKEAQAVQGKDFNPAEPKYNLMVIFTLAEPATSTTGDTVNPGYQLRRYYPLQQSPKEGAPDFRRDIVALIDAAFKIKEPSDRPKITPDTFHRMIGQQVIGVVKITESEQYGEQNELSSVKALS